jgi:hypothetical protein
MKATLVTYQKGGVQMKVASKSKPYNFMFQPDLRYRAQKVANKKGVALSALVLFAISKFIEQEEREERQAA